MPVHLQSTLIVFDSVADRAAEKQEKQILSLRMQTKYT